MAKIRFSKAYTRDFSIIMEEAWYYALSEELWVKLSLEAPLSWPNFYRFNKGIIEVWDNDDFIKKIKDAIWGKRTDTAFFEKLMEDYGVQVNNLNNDTLPDALYVKHLFETIAFFSIMWYALQDDRTEKKLRQKFVDIRDKDTLFDTNDKIVRKRILKKFPQLNGFETTLLKDEFLGNLPAVSVLKERLNNFFLVPNRYNQITSLENFTSTHNIDIEIFEKPGDHILSGITAQPGKAVGKVRIIRMKSDVRKMQQGEVLVSPMTTPDVFIAILKACAIVTDEGGQLCHAAIIAREQVIPCIIGTKVASELYHDGDLVEVDADKGIVRKIK